MGSALVVVVLVLASEAHKPSTEAMTSAARQLLGPDAALVVQEVDALPSDAGADALGATLHADAVVEVRWSEPDRRHAVVHVLAMPDHRWTDRELEFEPSDDSREKGRTVGLALASMVPPVHAERADDSAATPVETHAATSSKPGSETNTSAWPFAVTGALVGSSGLGGIAGGVGVDAGFETWLLRNLALRGGAFFRGGEVAAASASTTTLGLSGGLVVDAYHTSHARPFALSFRVDALLVHESFARTAFGETPASHAEWLPGADALVEVAWYLLPRLGVTVATGLETVFGTTRIFVDQDRVATVPPTRWLFEAGLRARF